MIQNRTLPVQRFSSKKDAGLVLLLGVSALLLLTSAIAFRQLPLPLAIRVPYGVVAIGLGLLIPWMLQGTYYEISGDRLVAHCGPFRYVRALVKILSVEPITTLRAGPAWSRDRLCVKFADPALELRIAPEDKKAFLQALSCSEPSLVLSATGLSKRKPSR